MIRRNKVEAHEFICQKVPVLNVVGSYSPFVEETVVLNGKLNPANTNWMKIQVKYKIKLFLLVDKFLS